MEFVRLVLTFASDSATGFSPERELWIAVLTRAVEDLADPLSRESRDAFAWIMSSGFSIGSFTWICEQVGIDQAYLRRGLALKTSRGLKPSSLSAQIGTQSFPPSPARRRGRPALRAARFSSACSH